MPQPILPTIHPQNCNLEDTSKSNVTSFSSIPKEWDKQITRQQSYISSLDDDPVWMKCKSVVFHSAGRVQNRLGIITGVDTFTHRGQAWVSWAAHASEQADFLSEHGAQSRLHGGYSRWMGYFENLLGVSSEPEYNDSQYIDEIDYSRNKSSA